uniref:Uncharacterized protein n=1 Tax=Setaria italica TaxID=4555 RepID=K3YCM5_SETIT
MNVDSPLFLLQVTCFKCGGVSLGVGTYHNVADGMSSLHFIDSWSDLCRGTQISLMPFIDHTLLRACDPPTPSFQHVEYQPPPAMLSSTPHPLAPKSVPPSPAVGIFKLTLADLTRLRSQLTAGECAPRFSTYPPLPDVFGNVIFTATPIAEASKVTNGLADGAAVIQGALNRMDNDYCRSVLNYLGMQPDLSKMLPGDHIFKCPNLGFSSWTRLPIHDADFGWGRPVFMGPITCEGLGFVLPSANGDGACPS